MERQTFLRSGAFKILVFLTGIVVLSAILGRIPNMDEYKAAVEGIELTKFAPPVESLIAS